MGKFSIYWAFGRKGFGCEREEKSIYIRLGFVTICLTKVDIEVILKNLLSELEAKDDRETQLLKRENDLKIHSELYNNKKDKLGKDLSGFKENIRDLDKKIAEKLQIEKDYKWHIAELEEEIAGFQDLTNENDELQEEIDRLEKELEKERFNLEYLEIYFRLR